ncbi:hypothetical protein PoB_000226100 [Plakobranchus ocellatus]|uniref:Uncharacterized protein n=1 Tax=Plakobranchus ocellatus TaxID=259542 RepID=A0AAV3X8S1_9GAST|nr:hypothetical protein PoB_000226100 [Plakobranchus ocellatus]
MSLKPCDGGSMVSCFIPPCDRQGCAAFPQAECRNNYCNGCNAEFWVGDSEVTAQCDSATSGRSGVSLGEECQGRTVQCFSDPCMVETCPGIPTAQCRLEAEEY